MSHGVVVVALCGLLAVELLARRLRGKRRWPVYSRPLMSVAEQRFLEVLSRAVPELIVCPQVQVCRFVEVRSVRDRSVVLSRYSRLSVDFALCGPDFRVRCAVELDDGSHERRVQGRRDAKKNAVLAAAGVPLVRVRSGVSVERVREAVSEGLGGGQALSAAPGAVSAGRAVSGPSLAPMRGR